jgi:hypothetical protein
MLIKSTLRLPMWLTWLWIATVECTFYTPKPW